MLLNIKIIMWFRQIRRYHMKQKFEISGMTCSACSAAVERAVKKLDGVDDINVNLLANTMTADLNDPAKIAEVIAAIEGAGYGADAAGAKTAPKQEAESRKSHVLEELKAMKVRFFVSLVFLVPLMYISMGSMMGLPLPAFLSGHANAVSFGFTQLLLTLPIMYLNRKYYIVGFKTLFKGSPNMDSLIAIGSGAAVVYGIYAIYGMSYALGIHDMELVGQYHMDLYFESAGTILTLITLGKYLEARSKAKTSDAINRLMELATKTATVIRNGKEVEIPAEELVVGDTVVVRPGQSIPCDGMILEGTSTIDQAAVTGESIPVEKQVGDRVIAATINKTGFLKFNAERVGENTTLAQIIRLVEDANSTKAPIARLADKISGVFVPAVITIAVLATIVWLIVGKPFDFALSIGIAVLVISCPCALGLATPVAIMVGTGKGAENGILIKSGQALETAHKIKAIVFDKTGTLTEGKPVVTDIITAGIDEIGLLGLAYALEKKSEHPLAQAICEKAEERGIAESTADEFTAIFGRGIKGTINGKLYFGGNPALLSENGISTDDIVQKGESLAAEGKTPLYFADESKVLGIIAVADVPKPTSRAAVEEFKRLGIKTIMLTGDNKKTAEAIRARLGVDEVRAELMPEDKEKEIRALQEGGNAVAMVGDGINDAPALARADVGIAIGAGTDIAIESADIVLIKSDLLDAVTAVKLSRAVIRNIKQNLFWAFFYNTLGIPIAAGVFYAAFSLKLDPMFAAAAMSLSSVFVVTNALRLRFFKTEKPALNTEQADNSTVKTVSNAEQAAFIKTEAVNIKEENIMTKTMMIEGMSCGHCSARVEKALSALDGVSSAAVNLEGKSAKISLSKDVADDVLTKAVVDAGYEVVSVK